MRYISRPRLCMFPVAILLVITSIGQAAVQYSVVVGVDYVPAGQKWANDAVNVAAALQAADPTAVITTISGAAGVGVTKANVLGAIAATAALAQAGDSFTFYYSGHGTYFGNPANPDTVGPSLNPCTEGLFIDSPLGNPLGGIITEADLTAAQAAFGANVKKLDFIDSCFAGGFWFGSGPANALTGSLSTLPNTTLIAAADENSTAPGTSLITNNWIADIAANGFNLTTMNQAQLTAMFNRIKPAGAVAPNIKSPPGFPAVGPGNLFPYDPTSYENPSSFVPGNAQILSNVPESSSLILVTITIVLFVVLNLLIKRAKVRSGMMR